MARTCSYEGCDQPHHAKGFCPMHYARAKRGEQPLSTKRYFPHGAHWREIVAEDENGCLIWQGRIDPNGYGRRGSTHPAGHLAYRQVYWDEIGPIPEGLTIDHLCRVHACVNPEHLEAVTIGENLRRGNTFQGINARKTHCVHGHEFTAENTRVVTRRGAPERRCRACERQRTQRYVQRKVVA